ncbi:MAG TPA: pitrilysin family protein [Acidobacteriota bacterium]|nr:pitrilysin family protein [Acidobacteriota bacterium]
MRTPSCALLLATLLLWIPLWGTPAQAQSAASKPLELPQFEKESLLNGMEILFLPTTREESQFLLMIRNGAAFDPVEKWGSTLLMTRMMLTSTEGRTPEQMRFALNSLNARIEARVDYDAIYFLGSGPTGRMPEILSLLADIVIRPAFSEQSFEEARAAVLQERRQDAEDPELRSQELLHAELFVPNPYGRPLKGTLKSLQAITLNDIKIQYRRLIMPNQAQLAFYHSGERERTFRALSRSWGSWVGRQALPFTFRRAQPVSGGHILLLDSDSDKAVLRWGTLGVAKTDPDYHALKVFEQYLMLSLPSWAQEVQSQPHIQGEPQLEARRMPGYLQLSIRCEADRLTDYFKRLRAFLKSVSQGEIDPERLREAKDLALEDFRSSLREPLTRLQKLLEMSLYEIGAGYVTTYALRVDRIDAGRLQAAVKRHVSTDDFVLAVSGPGARLEPKLQGLGTVRRVEDPSGR